MWWPLARPLLGSWPATQACALTGNRTRDPLVHRLALNPLSQGSSLTCIFNPSDHFELNVLKLLIFCLFSLPRKLGVFMRAGLLRTELSAGHRGEVRKYMSVSQVRLSCAVVINTTNASILYTLDV